MKKLMIMSLVGLTIFAALSGCAAVPSVSGESTASGVLDPSESTPAVPETLDFSHGGNTVGFLTSD